MLSVFVNRKGDILFTYPNVDLHQGDCVRFNGTIYLVAGKTLDVQGGFYEITLHEKELNDYRN